MYREIVAPRILPADIMKSGIADIDFDYVSTEEIPAALEIEQEGKHRSLFIVIRGRSQTRLGFPADEAGIADGFR